MKKITLFFTIVLLICCFADNSAGQLIPNAPFKASYFNAPDFVLPDLQGKVFQLSTEKGSPVLIFFGTTWCPSCRTELPRLKDIYEKNTKRGLKVFYINIMEPKGKVARFVKTNSLPFRTLLDENGEVSGSYGVVGVPTIVLIDKDGKLVKAAHMIADLPLERVFSSGKK